MAQSITSSPNEQPKAFELSSPSMTSICSNNLQGGITARLAKLETGRSQCVTDLPFRPSNPGKKGTYGMIKTNMSGKAVGSMGEYKYVEQVRAVTSSLHPDVGLSYLTH
jgi:hypothetical protein